MEQLHFFLSLVLDTVEEMWQAWILLAFESILEVWYGCIEKWGKELLRELESWPLAQLKALFPSLGHRGTMEVKSKERTGLDLNSKMIYQYTM